MQARTNATTTSELHDIEYSADLYPAADPHRWSIVLAGGEGERAQDYIRALYGRNRPKQYCNFIGTRSLFQHTIDRADRLSTATNRVTVVASHHRDEIWTQLEGRTRGTVLFQPSNRGTATGLFLALTHVMVRDPEATVVVYPSDHFVYPESVFVRAVSSALSLCHLLPERPLLLGIRPQSAESDYGWIQTGRFLATGEAGAARYVERFVEKPPPHLAETLKWTGGLWNTSILIARLETLWRLGLSYLPRMTRAFEAIAAGLHRRSSTRDTEKLYRQMESHDLSRELLEPSVEQLAVTEGTGFFWSDWGRPVRILETLERFRPGTAGGSETHKETSHEYL